MSANAADKVGGVSFNISLGTSRTQSASASQSDTARGATVAAGGTVNITATGAGQDSNILARGTRISGGQAVNLSADGQVNLQAASNTSGEQSSSSGSSASVGLSMNLGAKGGTGVTVAASRSKAQGDGQDVAYTPTQVTGGESVSIRSGGDTTLSGATVSAPQVQADVGGSLRVESLQDSGTYQSRSSSLGGAVSEQRFTAARRFRSTNH